MSKYVTHNKNNMGCGDWLFVLLQVLFIALKLTGYIEWSWWVVLLPTIIGACIVGGAIFVVVSVFVCAHAVYAWRRYQRRNR